MNKSNCFKDELALISDEKLRKFIEDFLNRYVPDYFYEVPASSSGKYHPEYALGRGGLVRHTKATLIFALELFPLEPYSTMDIRERDNAIAALIIHDTFKQGIHGTTHHTVFEHPLLSAKSLVLFAKEHHTDMISRSWDIAELVASHMGQWNTSNSKNTKTVLPKPQTTAQKFVHLCDYLASRKHILVDVKYEPSEKE